MIRVWPLLVVTACAFDPSGLPPASATNDAAPADGSSLTFDSRPPEADAPISAADSAPPDVAPAPADAASDACVAVVCQGDLDCTEAFYCCYEGVCAEGLIIGGAGCVPADDWEPCP